MYSPLANRMDLLVQRYREAVVTRRLAPGSELVLADEAAILNVPVSLVRNAFRQLASLGLVELLPQGRARVKTNNIQSLQALEYGHTRRRA